MSAADSRSARAVSGGGVKDDSEKPRTDLLSPIAVLGVASVLGFGAKKYVAHNWRKGLAWSRLIGAVLRHTLAFMGGEDLDPESGLPHVDHLACCAHFLQEHYRLRKELDDRWRPGAGGEQGVNCTEPLYRSLERDQG
jgi:Domain of unknown function (DUF5664)